MALGLPGPLLALGCSTLRILNSVPKLSCSCSCPQPSAGTAFRARKSLVEEQGMGTSPVHARVNSAPSFPSFGGHTGCQVEEASAAATKEQTVKLLILNSQKIDSRGSMDL